MRERLQPWADYLGGVALALLAAAAILFLIGNQPRERLLVIVGISAIFFAVFVYLRFTQVRATVISMSSQSNALGQIAGGPGVGVIGTWWSLRAALVMAGLLLSPVLLLIRHTAIRHEG